MGFRFKKRVRICKGVNLNFSKSGISTSVKVGNVTHNSKRGTTVNFGHGLTYHTGATKKNKETKESFSDRLHNSIEQEPKVRTEKQIKAHNIGVKVLWGIITIMSLMLSLALPIFLLLAIYSGWFTYKYDVRKVSR